MVFDRGDEGFLGWVFVRPAMASAQAELFGWTCPAQEEVGFRFHRASWGRGIATEAASRMLDLALADPETSAVVGCARASNGGSLRVLQKLGLVRIGEVWLPDAPEPTVTLIRRK